MLQPKVSIVTSSFNRGDIIGETAESIFAQEYENWEWCIVDDHSTNNTLDIIKGIADGNDKISYHTRTGEKRGANVCRNQGADATDGKYLFFLDDDDLIEPFTLKQRVQALESNSELDFGLFPSLLFRKTPHDMNRRWNIEKPVADLTRQLYRDPVCQAGGMLITRDAFYSFGKLDENLLLWQDIDLFFRLYAHGYKYKKFFDLKPDLHIRHADNSLSRGNYYNEGKTMSRLTVVRNVMRELKETGNTGYLKDVDNMLVDVYYSLLMIRHPEEAISLLNKGVEFGVINKEQYKSLKKLKSIHAFKLYKLPYGKKMIQDTLKPYERENTVGEMPYEEGKK